MSRHSVIAPSPAACRQRMAWKTGFGRLTDVAASELLADRADDGVPDNVFYGLQVPLRQGMLVHERVHGGKHVCRRGWGEGS